MAEHKFYYDHGTRYLELHALRAPVGNYATWITADQYAYDFAVQSAVEDFESEHNVTIFQLGRSGRHICIADTPENRRLYEDLQRAAIEAAEALWEDMRTERDPDAQLSEN